MSEPKILLVPEGSLDEPAPPTKKTPACPACGAKFSHSTALLKCKVCGLPDEIARLGDDVIGRWKRENHIGRMLRQRRAEQEAKNQPTFGGSAGRKKNKHGRRGVKT